MEYVRHEARLDAPTEDGSTRRKYLEKSAERGNVVAIAALRGPEIPDVIAYLLNDLDELHGRSGVDMNGLLPLTYATLSAWAALRGRRLQPHEVDALLVLDAIRLHPGEDEPKSTESTPAPQPAWPVKKTGAG